MYRHQFGDSSTCMLTCTFIQGSPLVNNKQRVYFLCPIIISIVLMICTREPMDKKCKLKMIKSKWVQHWKSKFPFDT